MNIARPSVRGLLDMLRFKLSRRMSAEDARAFEKPIGSKSVKWRSVDQPFVVRGDSRERERSSRDSFVEDHIDISNECQAFSELAVEECRSGYEHSPKGFKRYLWRCRYWGNAMRSQNLEPTLAFGAVTPGTTRHLNK
jgi:hypothetical protein